MTKDLETILEKLRRKSFKHGMEVGQEFPDENPDNLDDPCNAVDIAEALTKLEALIQTKVKEARIEEVDRLLADKELDLEWYLRYDGSENMNPQESGEENVASAVKEYATNRLATLSTPEQTKQEKSK